MKIVVVAFLCATLNLVEAQTKGAAVLGQVIGPDGLEIPNAQVAAFLVPAGASGVAGNFHWTGADSQGRFRMTLQPGRYVIRAKAEEAGYPDPNATLSIDPTARFPTVSVEETDVSGILVKLGKKGGILEGYVYDARSKTAVARSKVTLRGAHDPQAVVELTPDKTGRFQFTVPSKPIFVFASAPGYKTASFDSGQPLTLSGGEHRNILLELLHQ